MSRITNENCYLALTRHIASIYSIKHTDIVDTHTHVHVYHFVACNDHIFTVNSVVEII